MAGFENSVMVAKNINFDELGAKPHNGIINAAGKLPIGTGNTSPTPEILGGSITSPLGTLSVGYSSPNITLDLAGGEVAVQHLTGNTGGQLNPDGSQNFNILTADSTVVFAGSGSTLTQDFGISNLMLGSSGPSITTATNNVSFGNGALNGISTATQATAVGFNAMQTANASYSTAIGSQCLPVATGSSNTAIGAGTCTSLSTAAFTTAVGYSCLPSALSGSRNTVIGANSGTAYVSNENNNIIIGESVAGIVGESQVIRIGNAQTQCFIKGIDGVNVGNVAKVVTLASDKLGTATITAGSGITITPTANTITIAGTSPSTIAGDSGSISGSSVTIYTDQANKNSGATFRFVNSGTVSTLNVTDANSCTFIGEDCGFNGSGLFNTGYGANAFGNADLACNSNTGIGVFSLNNVSGIQNVCVGQSTGRNLTSGSYNTAMGFQALQTEVLGNSNVAIGLSSMLNASNSSNNVAIGNAPLLASSGEYNIALGFTSLFSATTGSYNVSIGYLSGTAYSSSESSNILISSTGVNAESNTIRIGTTGSGANQQNRCFIAGIDGVTVTGTAVLCATDGQLGTVASSERYKENISDIKDDVSILHLRPVEFNYKKDESKSINYGLIAEEVEKDFKYLCFYNDKGQPESVKYHEIPVLLLKEIQRLVKRIDELERKI